MKHFTHLLPLLYHRFDIYTIDFQFWHFSNPAFHQPKTGGKTGGRFYRPIFSITPLLIPVNLLICLIDKPRFLNYFIYSSLWALSRSCNSDILLHPESFFITSFASLSLSLNNSSEYNMTCIAFALCSCLSWHIFSLRLQVYHIKRDLS